MDIELILADSTKATDMPLTPNSPQALSESRLASIRRAAIRAIQPLVGIVILAAASAVQLAIVYWTDGWVEPAWLCLSVLVEYGLMAAWVHARQSNELTDSHG